MNETSSAVSILSSTVRMATPYLYAAVGETIGQLSGVLNLGVDGMMLMGAYAAYVTVIGTGSLALGLLAAVVAGGAMGLIMAFFSVTMQAEQGISGIGLYLFGLSLSDLLFKTTIRTVQTIDGFPDLHIPLLAKIPYLGPILFQQNLMVYGAFALVPIAWFVLNKTPWGLKIRAAGEKPAAADSLGVNVIAVRYTTVMVGGVLSGLAGASLSIALLDVFQSNMTNGMGFIAIALVYFGSWRTKGVFLGALLFSAVNAFQIWAQVQGLKISSDFLLMMPYVVTILVLVFMGRRDIFAPSALNKPYVRGE